MSITILAVRPIASKHVYALLDVELVISGVQLEIRGVQARHVPGGGTAIYLPTHREVDGSWRSSFVLPEEIREAMATAVLQYLLDTGVGKRV